MPPPESPRVVIIHNFLPPHRVPLFEAIAERMNLEVWILGGIKSVREWDEPDASPNVAIQSLPRITFGLGSRYNAVLINYTLPRMLRRAKPDVLICCGWDTPAAFYAAWWARRTNTPFIVWSGSTRAEQTWLRRATAPLVRWYVRSAKAWIAYGTRAKAYLVDLGADAARVHRAFNTVDLAFYAEASRLSDAQAVRARWKLGNRRVVLFVGNLLELKGVYDLIRAFAGFSETRNDVGLLLVGEGRARAALEALVQQLGLQDKVTFTGFLTREDIAACYGVADVLVLPSHSEVWGLVINEALACGVPVIASDVCGAVADLIEDGVNGFVVPARDSDAIASALNRMFDPERNSEAMRTAARQSVERCTFDGAAAAFFEAVKDASTREGQVPPWP